jgi:hypothetical protein
MFQRTRSRLVLVAIAGSLVVVGAGCGLDSSSDTEQNAECRHASVGHTTRDSVHNALGDPTMTDHETFRGRPAVSDIWVDGTVGFSFDEETGLLVEKDC